MAHILGRIPDYLLAVHATLTIDNRKRYYNSHQKGG